MAIGSTLAGARARAPQIAIGVGIVTVVVLIAGFVRDHSFTLYDDAYIYLRYVQSVRAGCGLRFNCADAPVEGFTSPLYLALLVAGSFFTTRLVTLTQGLCTLSLCLALSSAVYAAGHSALAPERPPDTRDAVRAGQALLVACVLGSSHAVLTNSVAGLEASLAAMLVTLTWIAVLTDRRRAACVLAVLCLLARPESVLLIVLLPVLSWARRATVLLGLAAAVLGITLVRWVIFHDFVPNTYWVKSGGTARHVELGLEYLVTLLRDHFPIIALAPLALLSPKARAMKLYFLLVTLVWFAFFVRTGGDVFGFGRLAFPLVPVLTVLAVHGSLELVLRIARRFGEEPRRLTTSVLVGCAFIAMAALAHNLPRQRPEVHGDPKVIVWRALGLYLHDAYPKASVATVPIGAIAYYSGLRVIDMLGLTTPDIAKAGRTIPPDLLNRNWIGHERHNLEWLLGQKPDLVVTTKQRSTPWKSVDETRAGFYAEWLFVRAVKEGRAPYEVVDVPLGPQLHFLVFARRGSANAVASSR